MTALYRVHLAPFEQAGDVAGAVAAAAALADELPGLLASRGPLRSPEVVKAFALRAATPQQIDRARLSQLRALPGLPADARAWVEAIDAAIERSAPLQRDVHTALRAGDRDTAFALALEAPQSPERAAVLLECAFELQTLVAARAAQAALDALPAADRHALMKRRLLAHAAAGLRELVEPSAVEAVEEAPRTWHAWFERLLEDPGWNAAEAVAACGELEYAAGDLQDREAADRLAALLLAAAACDRAPSFRLALPRVVAWLDRQDADATVSQPVHLAILTALARDEAWGSTALEAAYNATEALLSSGLDQVGYANLLEQLMSLWQRVASSAHIAWLADLFELLELHPGPRKPVAGFMSAALVPVAMFAGRMAPTAVEALERSCAGVGAPEAAAALARRWLPEPENDAAGTEVLPDALAGRLVGIYTLTPQVAARASDAIERRFPGVRVEVDASRVDTPALAHLAASADYLVVSVRSAKHAATDAIERHRPPHLPTLVPRGRGSARIVEALLAAVAS